jgi:hypothetical protein
VREWRAVFGEELIIEGETAVFRRIEACPIGEFEVKLSAGGAGNWRILSKASKSWGKRFRSRRSHCDEVGVGVQVADVVAVVVVVEKFANLKMVVGLQKLRIKIGHKFRSFILLSLKFTLDFNLRKNSVTSSL